MHPDDFWASTSNKQLNFLQHVLIRDLPSLTRYLAGLTVYPRASQHCVLIRDLPPSLTRYLAGSTVYPRASQHCVFTILKQHEGKSEGRRLN